MIAMLAMLYPCIHAIRQELPSVEHVLYADGRSFTARSASEIVEVTQLWSQWTSKLGLRENLGKAQYWHQTVARQRNLQEAGCPDSCIRKDLKILGYHFLSLVNRKINQSESARLTAAEKTVKQIRALPGSLARRSSLARMTVCPKASWGWICKRPSLAQTRFR
jgi:hypothetical protein